MSHSDTGGSGAHRWMFCPGSVKLLKDNPIKAGPAAADGTITHEWAENALLSGQRRAGEFEALEESYSTEDKARWDRVMWYYNIVMAKHTEMCQTYGEVTLLPEHQFLVNDRIYGTADAVLYTDLAELHVYDLKDGGGFQVFAEENYQLLYYALGVIKTLNLSPDDIYVHIVQPKMDHHDTWHVPRKSIEAFDYLLTAALENVDSNPDLRVPGAKQCTFCNTVMCPEYKKQMEENALVAFDDDELLEIVQAEVSVDQLTKLLRYEDGVKKMFTDARKVLEQLAIKGETVPGMKLVHKTGHRKWTDKGEVIKKYRKWGLKKEDIFVDPKLKSPAQLEKAGVPKADIAALTVRPDNGLHLVSESAKGKAITIGDAFEDDDLIELTEET